MATAIKLSDDLVEAARVCARARHRTPPKQIEHWARLGRLAEENPDLPLSFLMRALDGLAEAEAGMVEEYHFDD